MSDQPEVTRPKPHASPADEGLRCPECDYNLTGLTDARCPECGQPFDRERLLHPTLRPQPIPGWNDGERDILRAFVHTCLMTWFQPAQFGKHFPVRFSQRSAWLFRTVALVIALGIFALEIVCFDADIAWNESYRIMLAGVAAGPLICEAVLTMFFAVAMTHRHEPSHKPPELSMLWWGFVGFFRSFYIFSAGLLGLMASEVFGSSNLLHGGLAAGLILWWWYNLGRAVYATRSQGRVVAIALIPLAVVISIPGAIWLPFFLARLV